MTEELTIETLPVEIKVIRVGGHKMTKAVFNQIQEQDYRKGDEILGYIVGEIAKIYDDGFDDFFLGRKKWLLFISAKKQELRKSEIRDVPPCIPQLFIAT